MDSLGVWQDLYNSIRPEVDFLNPEKEKELFRRLRRTTDTREIERIHNIILRSIFRYIVTLGKGFYFNRRKGTLLLEDLISVGVASLFKPKQAVERFDPERGSIFLNYAIWWIRLDMIECLRSQDRIIKMPGHLRAKNIQYNVAEDKLMKELGRKPTDEEVLEEIQIKDHELDRIKSFMGNDLSLDNPFNNDVKKGDDYSLLIDAITYEDVEDQLERIFRKEQSAIVQALVAQLKPQQRDCLTLSFGLSGERPLTKVEIAESLNFTPQNASHHVVEAKKVLQTPRFTKILKEGSII